MLLLLTSCGDITNCYDEGYDDGYDGASRKTKLMCQESYNNGYDDGAYDSDCDYWKRNDKSKYQNYCT